MFIDEAKIRVKAGDGGNGCVAFRREKFVPRGGPSGGDGGHGGDVIMESSERHNTLIHFRYNPEYKGDRGRHGEGSNKTGREGEDIVLKVPVGTILYDAETGDRVHDFSRPDERLALRNPLAHQTRGCEFDGERFDRRANLIDRPKQLGIQRGDRETSATGLNQKPLPLQNQKRGVHGLPRNIQALGNLFLGQPFARTKRSVSPFTQALSFTAGGCGLATG